MIVRRNCGLQIQVRNSEIDMAIAKMKKNDPTVRGIHQSA